MRLSIKKGPIAFLAILSCVLVPEFAVAEQDPVMARAKALMDEAEYLEAQRTISRGLTRTHLNAAAKVELYWLQGICFISLDNVTFAKSSFLKLLALAPSFEPSPQISPKILSAFNETREHFLKAGGFDNIYQPRLTPLDDHHADQSVPIHFAVGNASRLTDVKRVTLYLRRQGNSDYTAIDLSHDARKKGQYIGIVPSNMLLASEDPYAVEYYVEATSASQTRLTGVGTGKMPLSFLVHPENQNATTQHVAVSSRASYWPYWLGVGAVLLGGAILGVVSLTLPQESSIKIVVHQP